MPIDFMQPGNNGHDDVRDVAYLPHHVRGLQTDVTAVINECLQDLDSVDELLRAMDTPLTRSERSQPVPGQADSGHYEPPGPSAPSSFPEPGSSGDFDARLANLKRLLAEKLTDQETG